MKSDRRNFRIGRECVGWEDESVLQAGAQGRGIASGRLLYFKASASARALPPLFADFSSANQGRREGNPVARADGTPLAEVMLLNAIMQGGDLIEAALAVSLLRKEHPEIPAKVTRESFDKLAGEWLLTVVERDGRKGLEQLLSWAKSLEDLERQRDDRQAADPDLCHYLRAVEKAACIAKGVPLYREVLKEWEAILAAANVTEDRITRSRFNHVRARAGFGWLPVRR